MQTQKFDFRRQNNMTFVIFPNGQSLLLCTHDVFHNTQRCGFGNGKTAILLCTAPPDFNPIMYCSACGSRMDSKGPRIKQINHSILQDGFKLVLAVSVRKWHCDVCGAYDHDHFTFVEDRKRNSNLVPLMIPDKMKDLNVTARQAARALNVSDTYVFETFLQFVSYMI